MSKVDLSNWTQEQIYDFQQKFRMLKMYTGDQPLALTEEQRDIAVQLGLIPPPSVMAEVLIEGRAYRGVLSLRDDETYRGAMYLAEKQGEQEKQHDSNFGNV